jgi:hypothetical protein
VKRPAFQFYADKWLGNAKLRRCSPGARGAWIDTLCLLHDSDEYGILRWPLVDVGNAIGVQLKLLRELVDKLVLKGSDKHCPAFIYTPRHGGKDGEPVTLIEANPGPCWYSSRMVRDEYIRRIAGASTRFRPRSEPTDPSPSRRHGAEPGPGDGTRQGSEPPQRQGAGSAFASALDTSGFNNTILAAVDNSNHGAINAPKINGNGAPRPRYAPDYILERGRAAGLTPRPGESFKDFEARINAKGEAEKARPAA